MTARRRVAEITYPTFEDVPVSQFHELLAKAGVDASLVRKLTERPELLDPLVAKLRYELMPLSTTDLFCQPEVQVSRLHEWNSTYQLGFTRAQLADIGPAPVWPVDHLVAVVLTWSLDRVDETAHMSWRIAGDQQPDWRCPSDFRLAGINTTRLVKGIGFIPRDIRWQVIDLGANRFHDEETSQSKFEWLCQQSTVAHAQVLQAAAYFPRWVRAMDGLDVPYVHIGGYQLRIEPRNEWGNVPALQWVQERGYAHAGLDATMYYRMGWAVPEVRTAV